MKLLDLRKAESWVSVVKTSGSRLSSKDTYWRSWRRSRFTRSIGWVTSTGWEVPAGEPRGVWGGCGVVGDHAVS